jgi:drug/metabolite transporter (DMT)-like permease
MDYFYLISVTALNIIYSLSGSFFNRKTDGKKDTSAFYNLILVSVVVIGWAIKYIINPSFEIGVFPYIAIFAVGYAVAISALITALKVGPIMLTNLFINLSLVVSGIWGLIFWNEPLTTFVVVGIILTAVSIALCLFTGKKSEQKITLKWAIYMTLAFVGNAACVISQAQQQKDFAGQHGDMFMFFATTLALIVIIINYIRSDKTDSKIMLKKSVHYPIISGVCNVLVNTFNIILATSEIIPASVRFPVISVCTLIAISIFSLFVFKEKLKWWQWVGIVLGIVATVLLSV